MDLRQLSDRDRAAWEVFANGPWVAEVNRADRHLLITLADPTEPTANRWADPDITFLVDVAEPEVGFVGTLVTGNPAATAWVPPGDSRVRRVNVQWIRDDGSVELEYATDVLPPPFLRPGQVYATTMHGFTPVALGNYVVRATADGELLFERAVLVAQVQPAAFEGSAEGMLASLHLRTPDSFAAAPGELLPLHVDATNTGRKSWTDEANIRLGWRWWKFNEDGSETEQPTYEGRVPLLGHLYNDIPPGRGYAFTGQLRAPDEPGRYVVRASVLVELVAWFENEPVEIEVVVRRTDQ